MPVSAATLGLSQTPSQSGSQYGRIGAQFSFWALSSGLSRYPRPCTVFFFRETPTVKEKEDLQCDLSDLPHTSSPCLFPWTRTGEFPWRVHAASPLASAALSFPPPSRSSPPSKLVFSHHALLSSRSPVRSVPFSPFRPNCSLPASRLCLFVASTWATAGCSPQGDSPLLTLSLRLRSALRVQPPCVLQRFPAALRFLRFSTPMCVRPPTKMPIPPCSPPCCRTAAMRC